MTESSEHRTITMMENGKRSYTFTSPLMEGYRLAANPYQEFRRGIEMTTYTDSLSLPEVTITANYAIYYERQKLWEAKGNVVVIRRDRKDGDTTVTGLTEVYTQQLFWNATTKKIYSNVDTKVLQGDGWHFGVGFDADDDLKNIHFRKYSSEVEFEMNEEDTKQKGEGKSAKEQSKRGDDKKSDVAKKETTTKESKRSGDSDAVSRDRGSVKRDESIGRESNRQMQMPKDGHSMRPTQMQTMTPTQFNESREVGKSTLPEQNIQRSGQAIRRDVDSEMDNTIPMNLEKRVDIEPSSQGAKMAKSTTSSNE